MSLFFSQGKGKSSPLGLFFLFFFYLAKLSSLLKSSPLGGAHAHFKSPPPPYICALWAEMYGPFCAFSQLINEHLIFSFLFLIYIKLESSLSEEDFEYLQFYLMSWNKNNDNNYICQFLSKKSFICRSLHFNKIWFTIIVQLDCKIWTRGFEFRLLNSKYLI